MARHEDKVELAVTPKECKDREESSLVREGGARRYFS